MKQQPDPVLLAEIEEDMQKPPAPDKLEIIRDKIRETRDLDLKIDDLETQVNELKRYKRELVFDTLPSMFMQIGINRIGIDAQGNSPAYEAKLQDHFHAVISSSWEPERRNAALEWLHLNKLGDVIKTIITIEFGLGQAKKVKEVLEALKKLKVPITIEENVPWKTLTSVVQERYKHGNPMSDADLHTLGASVNKIVKLTPVREK